MGSSVKNEFADLIAKYEDLSHSDEVDDYLVSVNLESEYFEFSGEKDIDRAERRFDRYVKKKYDQAIEKNTLKKTTEWDTNETHPAAFDSGVVKSLIDRK